MNKQIKFALIGAGNRGQGTYGQYALDLPHRAKFTAVVEPDREKREFFAAKHNIPAERTFSDYNDFFHAKIKDVDGVIIATFEDHRLKPALKSMEKGYHILIEKPLCTNAADLIRFHDAAKDYSGIMIVCHQLRLTPRLRLIKDLVDSGRYGEIVCIQHSENVEYGHMAHSFVRGFYNSSRQSSMLLSKCCHDLDWLYYLTGKKAKRIASFGSLKYFRRENCPEGAPKFCLDGCKHYSSCPYHVMKLYFEADTDPASLRQMGVVRDKDHLRELLMKNRFGRCVFQTDNDVVDNQTVQIEFEDGIHASFTMCGHNAIDRRMVKLSMTNGEIEYTNFDGVSGTVLAHSFEPDRKEEISVKSKGAHGGGDRTILDNFMDAIDSGDKSILFTPFKDSLEGHLMVFAAEESRISGKVVNVREYEDMIRKTL
ncbi:MAG: Gfo/Idh/MocA family oxidoreductase [Victivallales bacterium]|jgi:predicted dehydrogenase